MHLSEKSQVILRSRLEKGSNAIFKQKILNELPDVEADFYGHTLLMLVLAPDISHLCTKTSIPSKLKIFPTSILTSITFWGCKMNDLDLVEQFVDYFKMEKKRVENTLWKFLSNYFEHFSKRKISFRKQLIISSN